MSIEEPKCGDIVEYDGVARIAHCKCDKDAWVDRAELDDDFFNYGAYDSNCIVWFFVDEIAFANPVEGKSAERQWTTWGLPISQVNDPSDPGTWTVEYRRAQSEYAQISHLLPDMYGRAEHAAYMAKVRECEEQEDDRPDDLYARLSALMDGLCGKDRMLEE